MKKQEMLDVLRRSSSMVERGLEAESDDDISSLAYHLEDIAEEFIVYVEKRMRGKNHEPLSPAI